MCISNAFDVFEIERLTKLFKEKHSILTWLVNFYCDIVFMVQENNTVFLYWFIMVFNVCLFDGLIQCTSIVTFFSSILSRGFFLMMGFIFKCSVGKGLL